VLGTDLVRARRRGDKLLLQKLKGADKEIAVEIAAELILAISGAVGSSADEVDTVLTCVTREARHEKLFNGLKKLALDDCEFGMPLELDAPALRKAVFELACKQRHQSSLGESFDRDRVLQEVALQLGVETTSVEDGLFGDLKGAQQLIRASRLEAQALVENYEIAQVQGVILRAIRLVATVHCKSSDSYRRLFRKLKFRQLLYRLEKLPDGGYRIEIEGPFSLFESVTKYGLQLALVVPALLECESTELSAELRWGKERKPLQFESLFKTSPSSTARVSAQGSGHLRTEVETLLSGLLKKKSPWKVEVSDELLDIPGVGLCVPDLKFTKPGSEPVYLEVLGFWSREAVWKRVEWAQSNPGKRVLFAVSSRLRVSKEVLSDESGSSLYIFKGTMSVPAVLKQIEVLGTHGKL